MLIKIDRIGNFLSFLSSKMNSNNDLASSPSSIHLWVSHSHHPILFKSLFSSSYFDSCQNVSSFSFSSELLEFEMFSHSMLYSFLTECYPLHFLPSISWLPDFFFFSFYALLCPFSVLINVFLWSWFICIFVV